MKTLLVVVGLVLVLVQSAQANDFALDLAGHDIATAIVVQCASRSDCVDLDVTYPQMLVLRSGEHLKWMVVGSKEDWPPHSLETSCPEGMNGACWFVKYGDDK